MLLEPYIVQSKRHALDTSTERLHPVYVFDKRNVCLQVVEE
jgi:hypothetical protein